MATLKIKKGDTVKVIAGKDKGKNQSQRNFNAKLADSKHERVSDGLPVFGSTGKNSLDVCKTDPFDITEALILNEAES